MKEPKSGILVTCACTGYACASYVHAYTCMKYALAYMPRNTNPETTSADKQNGNLTTYHAYNTKTKQPKLKKNTLKN